MLTVALRGHINEFFNEIENQQLRGKSYYSNTHPYKKYFKKKYTMCVTSIKRC